MSKFKVLMLLMVPVLVLTACSGGNAGDAAAESGVPANETPAVEAAPAETATEPASPEAAGKEEIEFWYGLGGALGEAMEANLTAFNASQDQVNVTGVMQSGYDETASLLQAAAAAGDVPAAFLSAHQFPTEFYERGVIQILNDFIAADPDFHQEDIIPVFMSYCTSPEGQVYSLPVWGTTQVVYYRKDMLEEANIDPDEMFSTWQNVAKYAEILQKEYHADVPDFYGFEPMHGPDILLDMGASNGGDIVSEDQKTVTFDSPEMIEAIESMRKWLHDDKIMRTHYGGEGWEYWYKTIDDVMQGRSAGYIGSAGDQGDLDFSIIGAHVQPGFNDHDPNPYVDPIVVGMMAGASDAQKDAAFKLLTYLNKVSTLEFSMASGYMPVRTSAREDAAFKAHIEKNPQALVILEQGAFGREVWVDPIGGVSQAFADACDLIEIENAPVEETLKEAAVVAQQLLDEWWANGGPDAE